jgi:thiol-disulfide isomerase/thioredoxin
LTINNEQNELVSDSLIVDYLISKNARYLFNGNQADMRNVLVELFTATWCPNCPYAEDALHNLHEEYGNRFIYFEYHINDALQIPGNSDILNYYGESSLPVTVVNGNALVMSGAGPTIEHTIDSAIQPLLSEQAKAQICLNEMAINNNVLNVQIQMNIQNDVSLSELYLKYVVVEDYDEVNTNVNGDHLHNVVKYKNEISLADYVNQQPLDIIIEAIETYPQDSSIIFWIQTMESPYNESTCQVYNVIKKRIE